MVQLPGVFGNVCLEDFVGTVVLALDLVGPVLLLDLLDILVHLVEDSKERRLLEQILHSVVDD